MPHVRPSRSIRVTLLAATLAALAATPTPSALASQPHAGANHASPEGRTLAHSVLIHMPADELFRQFTTPEGIVNAWSVAAAKVDFRVGGQIRTSYEPGADLDAPTAIVNTILSFEPGRVLSLKATAPAGAPEWLQLVCNGTHSVIRFEPVSPSVTRLTITGIGYGTGGAWDEAYAFFERGNAWTLDQMRQKLGAINATDAREVMAMLASYEGEWIFERTNADGKPFRGRTRFYAMTDGAWIGADGWLGDDEGMHSHAHWVSGIDASTGLVAYTNYFEQGHIGRGHIEMVAPNTLGFNMTIHNAVSGDQAADAEPATGLAPTPTLMYFEFERTGPDAYTSRMYRGIDRRTEGATPMMELQYRRVEAVPESHLRMKADRTHDADATLAPVVTSAIVNAPIAEVWRAWTTSDGLSAMLGRTATIELRVGGPFEIYFNDAAPEGERGSEGCSVLSFIPGRMLSFSWNAPPQFPHARAHHAHVVVELRPINDSSTEITLTHAGLDTLAQQHPQHADEYRAVRAYFAQAWPRVMAWCQETLGKDE